MNSLKTLTDVNLDDLAVSFGWEKNPALRGLLRLMFGAAAHKFARRMLVFDEQVASQGLALAASQSLRLYASQVRLQGQENIPRQGAALFLANHPGMVDTLAAFTQINRTDLKILALDRPFLRALRNTSRQLIFLGPSPAERMSALRQAAAHLKAGGAALTFPAGKIDPDPAVYPGASEALEKWSDSAGLFLRLAPNTLIVPVLIRGVLWPPAVLHPLTRLRPAGTARESLGAALQLLTHVVWDANPLQILVQIGKPLQAAPAEVHPALLRAMRQLLAEGASSR